MLTPVRGTNSSENALSALLSKNYTQVSSAAYRILKNMLFCASNTQKFSNRFSVADLPYLFRLRSK
jgi:hypothetical protein